MAKVRRFAEEAGRDPSEIGMQMSLSPGALDREKRKRFYADTELLRERVVELRDLGFDQTAIDCVPIFQHGYRTVDAMIDYLAEIYSTIAPELDR